MIRIKRPFILTALTLLFSALFLMTGNAVILKILLVILPVVFVVTCIRKMAIAKAVLLITAAVVTAMLSFQVNTIRYENELRFTGYGKTVTGTVTEIIYDEERQINSALLSDCTVDDVEISSKILLYTNDNASFHTGERITTTPFRLTAGNVEGIFLYHSISDRIILTAFSSKDTAYIVTNSDNSLYAKILRLRDFVSEKLSSALSPDAYGISDALISGNTASLSPEFSVNLRKCGIAHIFAVSGMHLTMWTGLFFIIMKNKAKVSLIPNLLASAFVLFFIVFTGFSPSVMRSGLMLLFVFFGRILKKAADTLNTLGIAGTILLTVNPFLAGNVSFLLSFTATAAISLWNDYIYGERKYPVGKYHYILAKLKNQGRNLMMSFGVIITTLPLTSLFFGYFSLISPFASLITTPVAQGIMISSFLQLLIPKASFIYPLFSGLTQLLCNTLSRIVSFFADMDFTLTGTRPDVVIPLFIAVSVICAAVIIFIKRRKAALICVLSGVLVFSVVLAADTFLHSDEASVYIAGEDNSTLIAFCAPSGAHTTIYGAGGDYSQVYKLKNYLSAKGILTADLLFIPRDTSTENENSQYIEKYLLTENSVYATNGTYESQINANTKIYSETAKDFAASAVTVNNTKIVICTLPFSDFSACNEIFTSGDILISRSTLPKNVNTDNFSDIIIMTDKPRTLNTDFISTKDRDTEIIIKGDSYAIN